MKMEAAYPWKANTFVGLQDKVMQGAASRHVGFSRWMEFYSQIFDYIDN